MTVRIIHGNCADVLRDMPDNSVECCVTSPPYFGLRDYGVDGQFGLEPTPADYVERMVVLFREVRRVLKDDGTLWLNIGDSYSSYRDGKAVPDTARGDSTGTMVPKGSARNRMAATFSGTGIKHKDLIGIPWRLALAMQADGWWLRQDIIWHKPNLMPESVTDRCTKSHEYIFLLTKSARYYFDAEAIKEPAKDPADDMRRIAEQKWDNKSAPDEQRQGLRPREPQNYKGSKFNTGKTAAHQLGRSSNKPRESKKRGDLDGKTETRNKRSVWSVTTKPYRDAHFATFPPDLIRPCILAGCPLGGVVLDPFGGSGTTGMVSEEEGRNSILIELNGDYVRLSQKRTAQGGLFCKVKE